MRENSSKDYSFYLVPIFGLIILFPIFLAACVPKEKEKPKITIPSEYDTIILTDADFLLDSLLLDSILIKIEAEAEINRINVKKNLEKDILDITSLQNIPNYINKKNCEFYFQTYIFHSELIKSQRINYKITAQDENGQNTDGTILILYDKPEIDTIVIIDTVKIEKLFFGKKN